MVRIIFIGAAGFLGTVARYLLSGIAAQRFGENFPFGTLVVNLVGCFLAGFLFYILEERFIVDPHVRSIVLIGFLGGFTTFSAFGLQTFALMQQRAIGFALINVVASNVLGLFLVWAGYTVGKTF